MDNAVGAYEADKATVASQTANVKHLEQLVAFEKVVAPFDGLITARNTDIGQLVNSREWRRGAGAVPHLLHRRSFAFLSAFRRCIRRRRFRG